MVIPTLLGCGSTNLCSSSNVPVNRDLVPFDKPLRDWEAQEVRVWLLSLGKPVRTYVNLISGTGAVVMTWSEQILLMAGVHEPYARHCLLTCRDEVLHKQQMEASAYCIPINPGSPAAATRTPREQITPIAMEEENTYTLQAIPSQVSLATAPRPDPGFAPSMITNPLAARSLSGPAWGMLQQPQQVQHHQQQAVDAAHGCMAAQAMGHSPRTPASAAGASSSFLAGISPASASAAGAVAAVFPASPQFHSQRGPQKHLTIPAHALMPWPARPPPLAAAATATATAAAATAAATAATTTHAASSQAAAPTAGLVPADAANSAQQQQNPPPLGQTAGTPARQALTRMHMAGEPAQVKLEGLSLGKQAAEAGKSSSPPFLDAAYVEPAESTGPAELQHQAASTQRMQSTLARFKHAATARAEVQEVEEAPLQSAGSTPRTSLTLAMSHSDVASSQEPLSPVRADMLVIGNTPFSTTRPQTVQPASTHLKAVAVRQSVSSQQPSLAVKSDAMHLAEVDGNMEVCGSVEASSTQNGMQLPTSLASQPMQSPNSIVDNSSAGEGLTGSTSQAEEYNSYNASLAAGSLSVLANREHGTVTLVHVGILGSGSEGTSENTSFLGVDTPALGAAGPWHLPMPPMQLREVQQALARSLPLTRCDDDRESVAVSTDGQGAGQVQHADQAHGVHDAQSVEEAHQAHIQEGPAAGEMQAAHPAAASPSTAGRPDTLSPPCPTEAAVCPADKGPLSLNAAHEPPRAELAKTQQIDFELAAIGLISQRPVALGFSASPSLLRSAYSTLSQSLWGFVMPAAQSAYSVFASALGQGRQAVASQLPGVRATVQWLLGHKVDKQQTSR